LGYWHTNKIIGFLIKTINISIKIIGFMLKDWKAIIDICSTESKSLQRSKV
jgi:hypothetical protein